MFNLKVKMVDVARKLGISKATVSLAVNGKPGVNEQTREKIFQCIEEMEKVEESVPESSTSKPVSPLRIIKVVIINHRKQVVCDPELDLWSQVLRTFDVEARKRGYLYVLTYLNEKEENLQEIIDECNLDVVAGIILFGTEMSSVDYSIIQLIHKPLVIYDYEMPDGSYSSVCIDNIRAVEIALNLFKKTGIDDICYFSTNKDVYNFEKRRDAFQNILWKYGDISGENKIIPLGNSIEEITEKAVLYLNNHKLPDACIFENYQISIGVLTAVQRLKIAVPEKIKFVGIDEIPDYIVPDIKLTQIRIPHSERAEMAMDLLDREIQNSFRTKIKVFAVPELIRGETA